MIVTTNELVKATALLNVKEALAKQEYETVPKLIGLAKKFGATQGDIDELIADILSGRKSTGSDGANQGRNRLNFLKEGK